MYNSRVYMNASVCCSSYSATREIIMSPVVVPMSLKCNTMNHTLNMIEKNIYQ